VSFDTLLAEWTGHELCSLIAYYQYFTNCYKSDSLKTHFYFKAV